MHFHYLSWFECIWHPWQASSVPKLFKRGFSCPFLLVVGTPPFPLLICLLKICVIQLHALSCHPPEFRPSQGVVRILCHFAPA